MRAALAGLVATLLACTSAAATDAQFDGCSEVLPGPICALGDADQLLVWLAVDDSQLEWTLDSVPVAARATHKAAGGWRFDLALPALAGSLRAHDTHNILLFQLTLQSARPNRHAADATKLMRQGRLHDALDVVNQGLARNVALDRASLMRARARIHSRLDERAASHADFRNAIDSARKQGQRFTEVLSATALAFSMRHDDGDTVAAQALLQTLQGRDQGHATSAYFTHYHNATLRFHFEDVRGHLLHMRESANIAQRFGWQPRLLRTHGRMAVQWQHLGRRDKALELLETWRAALPADLGDSDTVAFWNSLAWGKVLALEAGETRADALRSLGHAVDVAERRGSDHQKINALINLGLGQWHAGQRDGVGATLDKLNQFAPPRAQHLRFWLIDLQARAASMNDDHARALTLYETMAQQAAALARPGEQWRALVRTATVLEATGNDSAALNAYREAETFLQREVLNIPLQEGRESLLATRQLAGQRQFDLLLKHQRPGDAMMALQRAQARARRLSHVALQVAALDSASRQSWDKAVQQYHTARNEISQHYADSWSWSAQELARRQQTLSARQQALRDQLDSAIARLNRRAPPQATQTPDGDGAASTSQPVIALTRTARGWTALVDDGARVTAFASDCDRSSKEQSAACLIAAARPAWQDASRVQLLVDSALQDIDWHALAVDDGHWIDHVAVRYSAALRPTQLATPLPGPALLVADPSRNLGGARAEIAAVGNALSASAGWSPSILQGSQATSPMLRQALFGAALFHYAGHASYGDELGWNSALELADDTRLDVGDILTLQHAPQVVVLSGCETATRPGITAPAMGLANAFVAAGSAAVIATSRTVDDASARAVTHAFYQHWLAGSDIADALRTAQLDVRRTEPDRDWAAFRLIEP